MTYQEVTSQVLLLTRVFAYPFLVYSLLTLAISMRPKHPRQAFLLVLACVLIVNLFLASIMRVLNLGISMQYLDATQPVILLLIIVYTWWYLLRRGAATSLCSIP